MKIFIAALIILVASLFVAAQHSDFNRGEFFGGFSYELVDGSTFLYPRTDNSFRDTGPQKFNGFNVSGVYNVARYVGLKGDFSAAYNGGDVFFPISPTQTIIGDVRNSFYNLVGGVQFKNNSSKRRLRPFAHAMAGVGHARANLNATCSPAASCFVAIVPVSSRTGFAGVFGGGLDLRLNDRFDLRIIQVDYNPVHLDSKMIHNARFGVGIVIK